MFSDSCGDCSKSLKNSNSISHISQNSEKLFNVFMKTIAEIRRNNLKLAVDVFGGDVDKLCEVANVSYAYLSQIKTMQPDTKTGRPRSMGDAVARKIEVAIKKPVGWMDKDHSEQSHANVTPAQIGTRKIPLISYVQAGIWTETIDPYQTGDAHEWLLTDLDLSEHAFGLEIKGDSMLPDFKPGDRVIIDPAVSPCPGDFVVAKNGEEEATFKKYRPRGRNEKGEQVVELVPLNPDYESLRSDITPFVIIGTMVEARRYRRQKQ